MKLNKRDSVRVAALLAALLMVAVGLILCRLEAPLASSTAPTPTAPLTAWDQPTEAEAAASEEPAPPGSTTDPSDQIPAQDASAGETARPAAKPQKPVSTSARKRAAPARKAVPQAYLPPFQPGLHGAPSDGPPGPPPNVLWLSGVIQGEPKLAVLRRGGNRYLVREGDAIDGGYRVARISSHTVTLQRRGRTRVLRLGQY
ncbi:MAG: hypothetical protein JSV79_13160 [Armatimonadota bacterium]|nr:MAG: hypothetical protein JSV79_13160 [Armatimonadota bacterium]